MLIFPYSPRIFIKKLFLIPNQKLLHELLEQKLKRIRENIEKANGIPIIENGSELLLLSSLSARRI